MAQTIKRRRYSDEVITEIRDLYPHCRSPEDKAMLARRLKLPSPAALYNLACRHAVTAGEDRPERIRARERAHDPARRAEREDPETIRFSAEHDGYIARHFGRTEIEVIALFTGHTETAVMTRARELGLRRAARHFELGRVCAWLGVDASALSERGLRLHRCCDHRAEVRITLVDTRELSRVLARDSWWRELVRAGADRFFIREVIQASLSADLGHRDVWDPLWVSHGHTCLNPFARHSFGLFYAGDDPKMTGANFPVEDLSPERIHMLR